MRTLLFMGALALVGATFLVPSSPSRADIYRCEARDGSLVFTNVREKGMRCVSLSPSSARTSQVSRQAARGADRSLASGAKHASTSSAPREVRRRKYDAYIQEASRLYHLPEEYIRAIVRVESDFTPNAVSRAGALGLMQLMPATARAMGVTDPFDPRQNILGGSRFLRVLANRFDGDLVLTTAAYNAGGGAVRKYSGVPPFAETQRYVRRVLEFYQRYRAGLLD